MSGVGQAVFMNQRSFGPPPPGAIGSAYEGGFYAGDISTTANGVATHHLVIGPRSTAETTLRWKNANTATSGTTSDIDGPGNTAAMISAGAAAHPCAQFCNNLTIGGFSDFYMPAKNELELCYFNFKPTTQNNDTFNSGINPNAVPARASNYTTGNPAQTSVAAFQSGGAEAFAAVLYWSSTQFSALYARDQRFYSGVQGNDGKSSSRRVRAVRRVAV